jgi:hypothetical protein
VLLNRQQEKDTSTFVESLFDEDESFWKKGGVTMFLGR